VQRGIRCVMAMADTAAARQLKRNFTDAMWERRLVGAKAARKAVGNEEGDEFVTPVREASSPRRSPRNGGRSGNVALSPPAVRQRVPALPLYNLAAKECCGAPEAPLRSPPLKRPSLAVAGSGSSGGRAISPQASPATPAAPAKGRPMSPARPMPARFRSPRRRLLTPRVSWSEIICNSQDGIDVGSPKTPAFRMRRPSPPPAKAHLRRRPPSDDEGVTSPRDENDGRFQREFTDIAVIGKGQFSTVFKARNCIDRCFYAVKKTTQISRQSLKSAQLREVFALANVSMEAEGCPNIVRYFSSWFEDGRLHIQTELCDGSLRDRMIARRKQEPTRASFGLEDVRQVMRDVATGLSVLHGCNFVHLDIKPDNILVSRNPREQGAYKIADLGLAVAAMGSGCDDVSEGDCRYLAKEVLRGDLSDLPKADVFALGLVCYELATNPAAGLPCNGDEWQRLRNGVLDTSLLEAVEGPVFILLEQMVHPCPGDRPPARAISQHSAIARQDMLQELHEKMRQQALEAERNRRLADTYRQELLRFTRQELLASPGAMLPIAAQMAPARAAFLDEGSPRKFPAAAGEAHGAATAAGIGDLFAASAALRARTRCGSRFRGPRRGRTFS